MTKQERQMLIFGLFVIAAFIMPACRGQNEADTGDNSGDSNFLNSNATGFNSIVEEDKRFRIGISNSFITSEYRTQMIDDLLAVNQEYMNLGLTEELIIYSENTDLEGQLLQIENLLNQNIDALIIYPGDSDALNETLEEIVSTGVLVISIGLEIDAKGVINVAHNQKAQAFLSATWLVDNIQQGTIAIIDGMADSPGNDYRMEGVYEALENYPGNIVVVNQFVESNEIKSKQVMTDLLTSTPDLAGYWIQDNLATGILEFVLEEAPTVWPKGTGEASIKFLKLWNESLETNPDVEFIAVVNAPGVGGAGLRIAVELLKGRVFSNGILGGQFGTTVTIPIPLIVTPENFEATYAEYVIESDYPDFYLLDYILTMEEVDAFFK